MSASMNTSVHGGNDSSIIDKDDASTEDLLTTLINSQKHIQSTLSKLEKTTHTTSRPSSAGKVRSSKPNFMGSTENLLNRSRTPEVRQRVARVKSQRKKVMQSHRKRALDASKYSELSSINGGSIGPKYSHGSVNASVSSDNRSTILSFMKSSISKKERIDVEVPEKTLASTSSVISMDTLCVPNYKLTSLEGLNENSDDLKTLFIQNNFLLSFKYLGSPPNLEYIQASSNCISSFYGFQQQRKLKSIDLAGNPITKHPYYRVMCLLCGGPQIKVIDGVTVNSIEREFVQVYGTKYPLVAVALRSGWLLDVNIRDEAQLQSIIRSCQALNMDDRNTIINSDLYKKLISGELQAQSMELSQIIRQLRTSYSTIRPSSARKGSGSARRVRKKSEAKSPKVKDQVELVENDEEVVFSPDTPNHTREIKIPQPDTIHSPVADTTANNSQTTNQEDLSAYSAEIERLTQQLHSRNEEYKKLKEKYKEAQSNSLTIDTLLYFSGIEMKGFIYAINHPEQIRVKCVIALTKDYLLLTDMTSIEEIRSIQLIDIAKSSLLMEPNALFKLHIQLHSGDKFDLICKNKNVALALYKTLHLFTAEANGRKKLRKQQVLLDSRSSTPVALSKLERIPIATTAMKERGTSNFMNADQANTSISTPEESAPPIRTHLEPTLPSEGIIEKHNDRNTSRKNNVVQNMNDNTLESNLNADKKVNIKDTNELLSPTDINDSILPASTPKEEGIAINLEHVHDNNQSSNVEVEDSIPELEEIQHSPTKTDQVKNLESNKAHILENTQISEEACESEAVNQESNIEKAEQDIEQTNSESSPSTSIPESELDRASTIEQVIRDVESSLQEKYSQEDNTITQESREESPNESQNINIDDHSTINNPNESIQHKSSEVVYASQSINPSSDFVNEVISLDDSNPSNDKSESSEINHQEPLLEETGSTTQDIVDEVVHDVSSSLKNNTNIENLHNLEQSMKSVECEDKLDTNNANLPSNEAESATEKEMLNDPTTIAEQDITPEIIQPTVGDIGQDSAADQDSFQKADSIITKESTNATAPNTVNIPPLEPSEEALAADGIDFNQDPITNEETPSSNVHIANIAAEGITINESRVNYNEIREVTREEIREDTSEEIKEEMILDTSPSLQDNTTINPTPMPL